MLSPPQGTGKMEAVGAEDWTPQTLASWRHSNLVGVLDPWFVIFKVRWLQRRAQCPQQQQWQRLQCCDAVW